MLRRFFWIALSAATAHGDHDPTSAPEIPLKGDVDGAREIAANFAFRTIYSLGCPFQSQVLAMQKKLLREVNVAKLLPPSALRDLLGDAIRQWCHQEKLSADCANTLRTASEAWVGDG